MEDKKQIIEEMIGELGECLEDGETLAITRNEHGLVVDVYNTDSMRAVWHWRDVYSGLAARIGKEKQK
jgi:hypothetical protein